MEQRLEDGLEQAAQDFLRDPVPNRGDTQRAEFAAAFVEVVAP